MHSEESYGDELLALTDDWDVPVCTTPFSDDLTVINVEDIDEAYDILCDLRKPRIYSFDRVNDNEKISFRLIYMKEDDV